MELTPVYQMRCSEDFEEYWRQSGHWNTVQRSRKRCRDFSFAVNKPGAAEWIIKNWGPTWEQKPIVMQDSILVAKYLETQGLHYSFILHDQDKPVAAHTFMLQGNDLVWAITYRDPAYDSYGVGTRLMDLAFHWAKDAGFKTIDLGGRHDYKIRWAPKASELWLFNVCPEPIFRVKQAIDLARRASRKVTNWIQNT
jgi:GNAT superfamily N-acetyltransferase